MGYALVAVEADVMRSAVPTGFQTLAETLDEAESVVEKDCLL
jgi:hypothetical protein